MGLSFVPRIGQVGPSFVPRMGRVGPSLYLLHTVHRQPSVFEVRIIELITCKHVHT